MWRLFQLQRSDGQMKRKDMSNQIQNSIKCHKLEPRHLKPTLNSVSFFLFEPYLVGLEIYPCQGNFHF